MAVGIFDSGLGGLTVFSVVEKKMPDQSFVYLGDNLNAPYGVRDASNGLGASRLQTTIYQVLPAAMPGIITGTIIGIARAIGESAPLLMIGMVAFILVAPSGIMDPATSLPVQIYLWADSPERGFAEKTSAAILVLLLLLVALNLLAIWLRKRFEIKW